MPIEERATWPRLDAARSWLSGHDDPRTAVVVARLMASGREELAAARARLTGSSVVGEAFARQRPDGSWGLAEDARSRILPTLWMVKLLAELGLDDDHDRWQAGVGFLAERAHTSSGVFSVDGTDAGVLSCSPFVTSRVVAGPRPAGRAWCGRRLTQAATGRCSHARTGTGPWTDCPSA